MTLWTTVNLSKLPNTVRAIHPISLFSSCNNWDICHLSGVYFITKSCIKVEDTCTHIKSIIIYSVHTCRTPNYIVNNIVHVQYIYMYTTTEFYFCGLRILQLHREWRKQLNCGQHYNILLSKVRNTQLINMTTMLLIGHFTCTCFYFMPKKWVERVIKSWIRTNLLEKQCKIMFKNKQITTVTYIGCTQYTECM